MRRVDTIMIVAIAFTDGNGAARVAAEIWIGTVSVGPPLDSHWLMTKSSAEMANTTAAAATIAGGSKGRRVLLNPPNDEAPRSAAASSYCLPIENSRPRTITTTKEIEKVTWPRIWASVPV